MRFATREAGREDVQTLKAEDDRIKWVVFPQFHFYFLVSLN